ncbi:MAG: UDP-N-acetylmuramate--L-alanine ligase [Candidatus Sericytochromatia bacterium]|nr:UDP-N-acetylmuramate--L-alanine ligase [Candidatus Sericytochromatia bacterium]
MNAPEQLHFIGIGGIGMSALALVALELGSQVSGSDRNDSSLIDKLRRKGATITIGHDADTMPKGNPLVVVSTAIKADNPELVSAKARNLIIWHRSQLLNHFMGQSRSLAITGTHGKTTTSAMAAYVLDQAGFAPTSFIGGEVPQLSGNGCLGSGSYLVAEVDESDRSLRALSAAMVVVTNLELDHLDHYKDLDEIIETMATFIRGVPADGTIILCADDAGTMELRSRLDREVVTYGTVATANVRAEGIRLTNEGSFFTVFDEGDALGEFHLSVLGHHNVLNALSVIASARRLGVPLPALKAALSTFNSVARRFQTVGDFAGMRVIDDYAHHPSEIRAVLAAARLTGMPITAVFQPHRYSRLTAFLEDFGASLTGADRVIVTDVYPAGESPADFPVDSSHLAESVRRQAPTMDVAYLTSFDAVAEHLRANARPGELLLMLGAGDITKLAHRLADAAPVATAG